MKDRGLLEGAYLCVLPKELYDDNGEHDESINVCVAKIMRCSNANVTST